MQQAEYRLATVQAADDALRIAGYAARFNVPSLPLMHRGQRIIETIDPTAFDESLQSGSNISLYWSHDSQEPLANSASETLTLRRDAVGLHFAANLPDTTRARDAVALVRSGVVSQMSFGFHVIDDALVGNKRTLKNVELFEVSLVERGAYPQTSAHARSLSLHQPFTLRTALRLHNWRTK